MKRLLLPAFISLVSACAHQSSTAPTPVVPEPVITNTQPVPAPADLPTKEKAAKKPKTTKPASKATTSVAATAAEMVATPTSAGAPTTPTTSEIPMIDAPAALSVPVHRNYFACKEVEQCVVILHDAVMAEWERPQCKHTVASAVLTLNLGRDGRVDSTAIDTSSGDAAYDQALLNAVYKAGPFAEIKTLSDADYSARFKQLKLAVDVDDIAPDAAHACTTPAPRSTRDLSSVDQQKQAYIEALTNIKDRKFAAATEQFEALLEAAPTGILASNCHYWLASLYIKAGASNYSKAREHLDYFIANFGGHPKLADALLTRGKLANLMGDSATAQGDFQRIVKDFPQSEAAKIAGKNLQTP